MADEEFNEMRYQYRYLKETAWRMQHLTLTVQVYISVKQRFVKHEQQLESI